MILYLLCIYFTALIIPTQGATVYITSHTIDHQGYTVRRICENTTNTNMTTPTPKTDDLKFRLEDGDSDKYPPLGLWVGGDNTVYWASKQNIYSDYLYNYRPFKNTTTLITRNVTGFIHKIIMTHNNTMLWASTEEGLFTWNLTDSDSMKTFNDSGLNGCFAVDPKYADIYFCNRTGLYKTKLATFFNDSMSSNNTLSLTTFQKPLYFDDVQDIALIGSEAVLVSSTKGIYRFSTSSLGQKPYLVVVPYNSSKVPLSPPFMAVELVSDQYKLYLSYPASGEVRVHNASLKITNFPLLYTLDAGDDLYRGYISTTPVYNTSYTYRLGSIYIDSSDDCPAIDYPSEEVIFDDIFSMKYTYPCYEDYCYLPTILVNNTSELDFDSAIASDSLDLASNLLVRKELTVYGNFTLRSGAKFVVDTMTNNTWKTKSDIINDMFIMGDLVIQSGSVFQLNYSPMIVVEGNVIIEPNATLKLFLPSNLTAEGSFQFYMDYNITLFQSKAIHGSFDNIVVEFEEQCMVVSEVNKPITYIHNNSKIIDINHEFNTFDVKRDNTPLTFLSIQVTPQKDADCIVRKFYDSENLDPVVPETDVISTAFVIALGSVGFLVAVGSIIKLFFSSGQVYDVNKKHIVFFAFHTLFIMGSIALLVFDSWWVHKIWNQKLFIESMVMHQPDNHCCVITDYKDVSNIWIVWIVALIISVIYWILNAMAWGTSLLFISNGTELPTQKVKILTVLLFLCEIAVTCYILYGYIGGDYIRDPSMITYNMTPVYPSTCQPGFDNVKTCHYDSQTGLCLVRILCYNGEICPGEVKIRDITNRDLGVVENCMSYWLHDTNYVEYQQAVKDLSDLYYTNMIIDILELIVDCLCLILILVFKSLTD
eukprot:TRINITY_DN7196_c0_g1_i1.p1 TRINITY_DN7196_c0_g1~~TRINITY_DN7196_c0_g1_i1.p1  ORF type:complete len:876 (+),score=119.35 TRINITY_DN7196_c0_g1_i1:44-2671(+)